LPCLPQAGVGRGKTPYISYKFISLFVNGASSMIPTTELAQQALNGLVMGGVYALIALGLTLIFGILDQVNFAHGELYMIGAYATLYFSEF
jgi:ABC-type branched-subunit amino acid transport system permease subunit